METKNQEFVEIDPMALLRKLWAAKFIIVFVTVVLAVATLLVNLVVIRPTFESTTRVYVVNQTEDKAVTTQDLQLGNFLVKDYKEIILSQDVLSTVISELKLPGTTAELSKSVSVSVPTDTRIVSITVKNSDPNQASRIANTLREVAAEKIIAVTKVSDVTTLEEAEVPKSPSSPNIRRNVILGFLAGAMVMIVIVSIVEILDDRVKKPEDIEDVMGATLLGVIPNLKKL